MYTELLLFSTYPLLSAYYLTVYIYRRMRLTTGVYGISRAGHFAYYDRLALYALPGKACYPQSKPQELQL